MRPRRLKGEAQPRQIIIVKTAIHVQLRATDCIHLFIWRPAMQTDRVEYPINSGYIQVVAEGHMLPAFWAHPDTGGKFPGVALIHDQWGLTPHTRLLVRKIAENGHYVIAPDLFQRKTPGTVMEARQLIAALGEAGPPYVAAAIGALTTHNHCNGDIGVVGIGMGGTLALHMAAHRTDLKAVVAVQGDVEPVRLLLSVSAIPLLAIYGERGLTLTDEQRAVLQLTGPGDESQPERRLITYPDAGADFMDEGLPGYVAAAADDVWIKQLDFFGRYLTGPSQPPDIRHKIY
jgi:carboxymethylenebutenolidase